MSNQSIQKIVLLGSGNVATHLGPALQAAGLDILQVYSRKKKNAQWLAKKLKTEAIRDITKVRLDGDLYLLAISDSAIPRVSLELAKFLGNTKAIIVHTSGATPTAVFKGIFKKYGSFYPLQTFSTNRPANFQEIPFCLYGNSKTTQQKLNQLAQKLTTPKNIYSIDDQQRAILHVAAVFANNFSNHLYTVADQLLATSNLPFDLLKPLILETARKVQDHPPAEMQTGPAIRGDQSTIDRHLKLLAKFAEFQELYRILTNQIGK